MQKLTTQTAKDGIEKPPGAISSEEQIIVAIAAILFQVDPCHINFGDNTKEYIIEAECIANQINDCISLNQLKTIVDETLIKYFSKNWGFYNRNTKKSVLMASMTRQIWELKNSYLRSLHILNY